MCHYAPLRLSTALTGNRTKAFCVSGESFIADSPMQGSTSCTLVLQSLCAILGALSDFTHFLGKFNLSQMRADSHSLHDDKLRFPWHM